METEETYMYQLVTPSEKHYKRLVELKKQYPELTYDNKGYDTLPKKIVESHSEQIAEITLILQSSLKGFSKFQNFKPKKDDTWTIRLQYAYSPSFTGVGYFDSRHWNPEEHGKY